MRYLLVLGRAWVEDDGVLSFEWILLATLLTIGIVGGLAAVRDALTDELGDVAEAAINIDQSFSIAGFAPFNINPSSFTDTQSEFVTCAKTPIENQQDPQP